MSKLIASITEMFALQSLLRILVLWGLACIVPFMLLLPQVPRENQTSAVFQMCVAFGVLYIFFARYIRVNKPAQEEK